MNIAEVVSTRSHDSETQVGCVIVDSNKRIISTGYNGFPPGCKDSELPTTRPEKYKYMIHAEINAIATCRVDLNGASLYTTTSPCSDCVKAIITSGIKKVIFKKAYRDSVFSIELLINCGVEVVVL